MMAVFVCVCLCVRACVQAFTLLRTCEGVCNDCVHNFVYVCA